LVRGGEKMFNEVLSEANSPRGDQFNLHVLLFFKFLTPRCNQYSNWLLGEKNWLL